MSSFASFVSLSLLVTSGKYLSEYEYVSLWLKSFELMLLAREERLLFLYQILESLRDGRYKYCEE